MIKPDQTKVRVMIAIPSRDVWKSDFGVSFAVMLAATMTQLPFIEMGVENAKGCSLAMNRIDLCQKAIDRGYDYVLFLDDDMRVPMCTLMMMLRRQVDIIGANCARREYPPAPTAKGFDGNLVYTREKSTGIEKVLSVGTGIMMISTDVFNHIEKPWFMEDPVKRVGEDVFFCRQAQAAGYDIFIDHDVSKDVLHVGEFEYGHHQMEGWDQ